VTPRRKNVRRRPTLPRSLPRSTIGAEGLSFRVRNETGRFPFAMTTETLWSCLEREHLGRRRDDRNSGTAQWTLTHANLCCWLSPRPISTGRLHALPHFHLRPINPVVYWGPYQVNPVGDLILKQASRLDAFSGYPFRT
jgi:hypothetical protein